LYLQGFHRLQEVETGKIFIQISVFIQISF